MRPLQQRVSALPQWIGCRRLLPGAAVATPPIVPSRMLTATITPIRRDGQSGHGWLYHLLGAMSISLYCCGNASRQGSRLARTPALPLTRQPAMPTAGPFAGNWSPSDLTSVGSEGRSCHMTSTARPNVLNCSPPETVIDGADWISLDSLLSVKAEKQLPAERRERRYGNAHFFGGG